MVGFWGCDDSSVVLFVLIFVLIIVVVFVVRNLWWLIFFGGELVFCGCFRLVFIYVLYLFWFICG